MKIYRLLLALVVLSVLLLPFAASSPSVSAAPLYQYVTIDPVSVECGFYTLGQDGACSPSDALVIDSVAGSSSSGTGCNPLVVGGLIWGFDHWIVDNNSFIDVYGGDTDPNDAWAVLVHEVGGDWFTWGSGTSPAGELVSYPSPGALFGKVIDLVSIGNGNNNECSYSFNMFVDGIQVRDIVVEATLTPTPSATPTSAPFGSCVNVPPNVTPTPTRTPTQFGAATSTPNPATSTPGPSPTPSPFPTLPPADTIPPATLWTFDNGAQGWNVYPGDGGMWVSDFSRSGSGGSLAIGGSDWSSAHALESPLVLPGPVGANWVMSGYFYVDADPASGRFNLMSFVWGHVTCDTCNPDPSHKSWLGHGVESYEEINAAVDQGAWLRFFVWPYGASDPENVISDTEAFKFEMGDTYIEGQGTITWDEFIIYLDDLQWFRVTDSIIPHCEGGPVPVGTPVPLPTINWEPPCTDEVCVEIEPVDTEDNPCLGWQGFAVDVPGSDPFVMPGVEVCFVRYYIGQLRVLQFDFSWLVIGALVAVPVLLIIQMVRTGHN